MANLAHKFLMSGGIARVISQVATSPGENLFGDQYQRIVFDAEGNALIVIDDSANADPTEQANIIAKFPGSSVGESLSAIDPIGGVDRISFLPNGTLIVDGDGAVAKIDPDDGTCYWQYWIGGVSGSWLSSLMVGSNFYMSNDGGINGEGVIALMPIDDPTATVSDNARTYNGTPTYHMIPKGICHDTFRNYIVAAFNDPDDNSKVIFERFELDLTPVDQFDVELDGTAAITQGHLMYDEFNDRYVFVDFASTYTRIRVTDASSPNSQVAATFLGDVTTGAALDDEGNLYICTQATSQRIARLSNSDYLTNDWSFRVTGPSSVDLHDVKIKDGMLYCLLKTFAHGENSLDLLKFPITGPDAGTYDNGIILTASPTTVSTNTGGFANGSSQVATLASVNFDTSTNYNDAKVSALDYYYDDEETLGQ